MALVIVLAFYYFFYIISTGRLQKLKIDQRNPSMNNLRQEWKHTIISLLIFLLVGILMDQLQLRGYSRIYFQPGDFPWWYTVLSVPGLFLLYDAYFYFMHRLLHTGIFFRKVHIFHHKFHSPNPVTAYAFHPVEAIFQIGFLPLVMAVLPLYQGVLYFFVAFLFVVSTYGHLGFELRAGKKGMFKIFNTAIHHYLHHKNVHYNFGFYLNFWDKIFGTNDPDYFAKMERFRKGLD